MARQAIILLLLWFALSAQATAAENVFIIVVDGARYTETFGSKQKYIPTIWNQLRRKGTIYTNFRNEGATKTCPGHAAMLTGMWEDLKNDGSERPVNPTVFELFRKESGSAESSCYVISGKPKLEVLTYSNAPNFGARYGARFVGVSQMDDTTTWEKLQNVMDADHPRLVIVNFPDVDLRGHDNDWWGYLRALRRIDSIIGKLWKKIEADPFYRNTTTLFLTSDHGRHDIEHGGFKDHGDGCEGCRHIMLLAVGKSFSPNAVIREQHSQIDIAATAAAILRLPVVPGMGKSLLHRAE